MEAPGTEVPEPTQNQAKSPLVGSGANALPSDESAAKELDLAIVEQERRAAGSRHVRFLAADVDRWRALFYQCPGVSPRSLERPHELFVRQRSLAEIGSGRAELIDGMWKLVAERSRAEKRFAAAAAGQGDGGVGGADLRVYGTAVAVKLWEDRAYNYMDNLTRMLFDAYDTQYIGAQHLRTLRHWHPANYSAHGNSSGGRNTSAGLALGNGLDTVYIKDTWTFLSAVFFTSTLLTTIGYGNLVPVTFNGRMFCIAYGLLGVPLILITVADIGKFLSENIIWAYCRYVNLRKSLRRKLSAACCRGGGSSCSRNGATAVSNATGAPNELSLADFGIVDEEELRMRDELARDLNCPLKGFLSGCPISVERFGLEDYISIPVSLVLAILVGYVAIGAVLLGAWERWDFFTGFYFSFITMTTVGFGDIVPVRQEYFLLDLLYIVIGLAITTMCIDLVGIQYIRKIHYFGRAIKDARYALVNVGGRMVHVSDLMKYASVLQKKYGIRGSDNGAFGDHPFEPFPGSFRPADLRRIRYIDSTFDCNEALIRRIIAAADAGTSSSAGSFIGASGSGGRRERTHSATGRATHRGGQAHARQGSYVLGVGVVGQAQQANCRSTSATPLAGSTPRRQQKRHSKAAAFNA